MREKCPNCGNWTEGKRKDSFGRNVVRKGVGKGTGFAIGSAIGSVIPGLGTVAGGIIGTAASALFSDETKAISDATEDIIFDEEYDFTCPCCGYEWSRNVDEEGQYNEDEEVDDEYYEDDSNTYDNDVEEYSDAEEEQFYDDRDSAIDNLDEIKSDFDSFANKCLATVNRVNSNTVKAEYFYLIAYAKLEQLQSLGYCDEFDVVKLDVKGIRYGSLYINKAINLIRKSIEYNKFEKEFNFLKSIYDLWDVIIGNMQDSKKDAYIMSALRVDATDFNGVILNEDYLLSLYIDNLYYFVIEMVYSDSLSEYNRYAWCKAIVDTLSQKGVNKDKEHCQHQVWVKAVHCLSSMTADGTGCTPNESEARKMAYMLSHDGDFYALYNMANHYANKGDKNSAVNCCNDILRNADADDHVKEMTEKLLAEVKSSKSNTSDSESFTSSNDAEREYSEAVADILQDGAITDRDRKILDKLRKSLGISEEKAKKIEDAFSDKEDEYLFTLMDILNDGSISDKERKILDRLRASLGISEKRARELENMMM